MHASLLGPQKQPKARWTRLTVTLLIALGVFLAMVALAPQNNGGTLQQNDEAEPVAIWNQMEAKVGESGNLKTKQDKKTGEKAKKKVKKEDKKDDLDGEDIPPKKDKKSDKKKKDKSSKKSDQKKDQNSKSSDKKEDKDSSKEKQWYEKESWGDEPECQADGKKGEPTLETKNQYLDLGWVCGKDTLTVACDSKKGLDIDTVFVVVHEVKQHKFTGGLRTDEAKQLDSVTRSMRITRKCNGKDLMKTNQNRCEIAENDFAHGEDNTSEDSKKRRFMVRYECRYGQRNDLPDDYVPTIATPAAGDVKTTSESSQNTTQEPAKGASQGAQRTTQESVQQTTQQQAAETTKES